MTTLALQRIQHMVDARSDWNDGYSVADIAHMRSRHPSTIRRWLKATNLGVMPPKPSTCDDCGDVIGDGMSCPDGAFICYGCFNQGGH